MCGKQGWGPPAFFSDMQYLDGAIHWTYIVNECHMNPQIIPPSLLTQFIHVAPTLCRTLWVWKIKLDFYFSSAWKCGPQRVKYNGSIAVLPFLVTSHPRDIKDCQKNELSHYLVCEFMEVFSLQLLFCKTSNNMYK